MIQASNSHRTSYSPPGENNGDARPDESERRRRAPKANVAPWTTASQWATGQAGSRRSSCFFDLVFVFTLTQLTALLSDEPDAAGLVKVVLLLSLIWWIYDGYAWLTNVRSCSASSKGTRRWAVRSSCSRCATRTIDLTGLLGWSALREEPRPSA
ncbi:MAG: low temperature requirement protein A [Gaiellaceae bacterium]